MTQRLATVMHHGNPSPPERADTQTGLLATQLYEIRRRVRSRGPVPLAHSELQIHRTGAQLQEDSQRCRAFATAKQIDIALTVEIATGRITTDAGLPTVAEVRRLVHGSAGLPDGAFGLLPEQTEAQKERGRNVEINNGRAPLPSRNPPGPTW